VGYKYSAIRFVTPEHRRTRSGVARLAARHVRFTAARARTPARWSGATRNWSPITTVSLDPEHGHTTESPEVAA